MARYQVDYAERATPRIEPPPATEVADDPAPADPETADREMLLDMLAQQQRVAQAGLVTAGLIHDVRNHVQLLSGTAFLATQGRDPQAWFDALERIQEACCELTRTTSAFMGFVKRRNVSHQATFRVSAVLSSAERILAILAKRAFVQLEVEVRDDAWVRGDAQLAVQAVVNLASNAIHACRGQDAVVRITSCATVASSARIEVADTGPGIPEDLRERLFRPFVSGDTVDGHGLGLFVVRQVVRRLGGSIRLLTSPSGTKVRVDFPVA